MTCQRCHLVPATVTLAFRHGINSLTEAAALCEPCKDANIATVGSRGRSVVTVIDVRPEWVKRDLRRDLTPAR